MPEASPTRLVITAELPCRRCRYPLLGQEITARCPECGLLVDETLRASIDLATLDLASRGDDPARRDLAGILLLGVATSLTASIGLLVPLAIITAPVGFAADKRGTSGGIVEDVLLPPITWVAIGCILSVILLGLAIRPGPGLRTTLMRRSRATTSTILLLVGGLLGIAPAVHGLLGGTLPVSTSTPSILVLIAPCLDTVRSVVMGLLVIGLGRTLTPIGRRSERYATAGDGLQNRTPFLVATAVAVLSALGWCLAAMVPATTSLGGLLRSMPWDFLWLGGSALAALGAVYLAANTVWATAPWWRRQRRISQLVGPAESISEPSASMADGSEAGPAPWPPTPPRPTPRRDRPLPRFAIAPRSFETPGRPGNPAAASVNP